MMLEEQEGVGQPDAMEEDSSFLPKLEDLAALTGLFNPERIVQELDELDELEHPPLRGAQSDGSEQ
ncbi:hypothetical protein DNI29_16890 [Hymenobacter sediminis]|uniref:hypothetical protein n=1 Tax=Hymenobacter sediminis TaxID=2218621 RepID=UPI000DA6B7A8|nr:hypothetical protein [Hymenobacter sediminis]RPD45826.1 hypothetical protein DNI29_16890 [Hymenobacter sediminis]